MKFVLPQSSFQEAILQNVSKSLKIEGGQVMLPKTDLSPVGTRGPLGVNFPLWFIELKVYKTLINFDYQYIKIL